MCVCSLTCYIVDAINKSRNGIVRNTDSFFKDDNGETRKITLTPNLLRDDSSRNIEVREVSIEVSLEYFRLTFVRYHLAQNQG